MLGYVDQSTAVSRETTPLGEAIPLWDFSSRRVPVLLRHVKNCGVDSRNRLNKNTCFT